MSDTHGLVRPEVFAALDGVDLILHAGDVGGRASSSSSARSRRSRPVYGNTDAPGEPGPARPRSASTSTAFPFT